MYSCEKRNLFTVADQSARYYTVEYHVDWSERNNQHTITPFHDSQTLGRALDSRANGAWLSKLTE